MPCSSDAFLRKYSLLGLIVELPEGAFRYTSMYIAYKLGGRYYFDGYKQLTRSTLRYSWGYLPTLQTKL